MSERVPEPLEMSDAEKYEFIECDCLSVRWLGYGWDVTLDGGKGFYGQSLGEAIGKAAFYCAEVNRDF